LSEVIKLAGRLGRLRLSSPLPDIESIDLSPRDDQRVMHEPEAPSFQPENVQALLADEYQRGYQNGVEEGRKAAGSIAEQRMADERKRIGQFLQSLAGEQAKLTARLEQEAFRFAIAIAGRVVKHEVTIDDEIVLRQIQEGIRRVVGVESLKLRVNPRDEAMVRSNKSEIMANSQSVRDIVIESDDKIEPGGCILETSSGTVDARVFTQLEQIEAALFGQVIA